MTVRNEKSEAHSDYLISDKIAQYLSSHSRVGATALSGCPTSMHRLEVKRARGRGLSSMRAMRDFMFAHGKQRHAPLLVNLAEIAAIFFIKSSQLNDFKMNLANAEYTIFKIHRAYLDDLD